MHNFTKFLTETPKEVDADKNEKELKDQEPEVDIKDSEIGEWTKSGKGWIVRFTVNGIEYTAYFSPLDAQEKHWKFTYSRMGQRDSSDIKKFGPTSDWLAIWEALVEILKDFIRIFKPVTTKYIGMSSSKRQIYFRELFKLYIKHFVNGFRRLGYISSFDKKNYEASPFLVIFKSTKKKTDEPKDEVKEDLDVDYKLFESKPDRRISKGVWVQPEEYRKEGDDGQYFAFKVEFIADRDRKSGQSYTSIEGRFKEESEGLDWARTVEAPAEMSDDYVKTFGTATESKE